MIGSEGQRRGPGTIGLAALAASVLAFLIAPVVIIVLVSISSSEYLSFPPPALSLRWYGRVLGDPSWRRAFSVSVQVGGLTMLFATSLGVLAALGLVRGTFQWRNAIYAFLLSPIIVPTIITAIGLYFLVARVGWTGSVLAMALGHTVLALPVVVIIVSAGLQGFDERLEHAALSLGASRWRTLRKVTLPLIGPAVLSAALFAFLTSFDELLIPLFLSGVRSQTITVKMWNSIQYRMDPSIAAVSTFLIGVTGAILIASTVVRRGGESAR